MSVRPFLARTVVLVSLAASVLGAAVPPPNLILAHDLGDETIGSPGGTSYPTPTLDRLAVTGARFTPCSAPPLGTPTRVQPMTDSSDVRNYRNFGRMDPAHPTFGNHIQHADDQTAFAGKGQPDDAPVLLPKFGFAESGVWPQTRRSPRYASPGLEYNGVAIGQPVARLESLHRRGRPPIVFLGDTGAGRATRSMFQVRTLGGAKDATYSPRQNSDLSAREFAFTAARTLGRRGGFSDLPSDPAETKPRSVAQLTGPDATDVPLLQAALPGFAAIHPPHLDRLAAASIADKAARKASGTKQTRRRALL